MMTKEYLLEKAINDVTERYGQHHYDENKLEITLEKYYKDCDFDFDLNERVIIWKTVSESIKYN